MKRVSALVALVLSLCLFASVAAAAETMKGMIKKVDDKAGTITFSRDGTTKDEVLTVDKSVDLKKVKANAKAQVTVDAGVVKEIKAEAKRSAGGY